MSSISFAHPWMLIGLAIVPLLIAWYVWRYRKQEAAVQYSDVSVFAGVRKSLRIRLRWLPFALRMVALLAAIVALAQPQSTLSRKQMQVEGIDIVLALDISGSMQAEDFSPNRLEAAKKVAADFIDARKNDRIGLVVFAGQSFTQTPLTIDHRILNKQLSNLKSGIIKDGTALGDGLATAVNRLKDSQAKSKVIILLTDGVNNQGSVDPQNAAEIAAMYGIRLYIIGVGTNGRAPFHDQFGRVYYIDGELDEALMREMAATTDDGQYFRATNQKALKTIFNQIDEMETSKIDVTQYSQTKDEQAPLIWIAVCALIAEVLVGWVWFKV